MISEATEVTFSTVTMLADPDGENRGPAWLLWEYHRGNGSWFLSVEPFAFTEGSITWDPFPMVTDSDQVSDQQGVFALAIAEIFTVASGRSVPDGWEITRMDAERKFAVLLKYMAEQREAVWVEFGKDAL
jgi:hypothetical protein